MKEGGDGPGRDSARGNAAEALERERDGALFINFQENDDGFSILIKHKVKIGFSS